jgi:hypothetical protein
MVSKIKVERSKAELRAARRRRTNERLAVEFLGNAATYALAGSYLIDFQPKDPPHELICHEFGTPRYYLFCHAFELLLKSFILSNGGDQSELRAIGHSLELALRRAKTLGYKPSDGVQTLISSLHPFHLGQDFRYTGGLYCTAPDETDLMPMFKIMHKQIEPLAIAAYQRSQLKVD